MYLLGLGLILMVMKYMEYGAVATWSWWTVLAPLGLAVAWWAWADASGYTRRKAMERELKRKEKRLERQREALGAAGKSKSKR